MKVPFIKYLSALLLFGLNGIVASHIHLSSCGIVLLRTCLGSILLIALFLGTKHRFTITRYPKDFLAIAISGIATGASWLFLYEAYQQIGVGISSLLYYCGPVIVMMLSPLLFREKLTIPELIGFFGVLFGVFLVNGNASGQLNRWGILCGAMSALLYSVMVIANKESVNIKGMQNSCIQVTVSFLTVAVYAVLRGMVPTQIAADDWKWILILGLLNTGLGCYLYFSAMGSLHVQTVAICGYLEPLSAVIFSMLLLHESMLVLQILGAVLIIGGAIFAEICELITSREGLMDSQ